MSVSGGAVSRDGRASTRVLCMVASLYSVKDTHSSYAFADYAALLTMSPT